MDDDLRKSSSKIGFGSSAKDSGISEYAYLGLLGLDLGYYNEEKIAFASDLFCYNNYGSLQLIL